jgi:hypothetical protein
VARKFNFDLYRLNIVDIEDLFIPEKSSLLRGDTEIATLVEKSCSPDFDIEQETRNALYKWSLRYFTNYSETTNVRHVLSVVLCTLHSRKRWINRYR